MTKRLKRFILTFAEVMFVFLCLEGVLRAFQTVQPQGQLATAIFWVRIAWAGTFALFVWRGCMGFRKGDLLFDD